MHFDFKEVITRLESQKGAIDQALAVLREFDGNVTKKQTKKIAAKKTPMKKRTMSEAGKKAIGDAVRKRWAAKKKAAAAKKV